VYVYACIYVWLDSYANAYDDLAISWLCGLELEDKSKQQQNMLYGSQ